MIETQELEFRFRNIYPKDGDVAAESILPFSRRDRSTASIWSNAHFDDRVSGGIITPLLLTNGEALPRPAHVICRGVNIDENLHDTITFTEQQQLTGA